MTKFGLNIGQHQCTIDELRTLWSAAEEMGFEWFSVWDHFYPDNTPYSDPCFEGLALHAAMAAVTTTPRLGSTVYCTGFRHPAVLANAAATIDHLSGGRLEMGLGAG